MCKTISISSVFCLNYKENNKFWKIDMAIPIKILNMISFQPTLSKKKSCSRPNHFKNIWIYFINGYLIYSKNKEWRKCYKYLDLNENILMMKIIEDPNASKYGIRLTYGSRFIEIYFANQKEMASWVLYLKQYCVQTNFDEYYTIERKLGQGSYGLVYLVKDKLLKTKYAAKYFDLNVDKDKKMLSLVNEIKIQRQLNHKNIARFFEFFEKLDQIIIILEYIEGERLVDFITSHGQVPELDSAIIFKQLLLALQEMKIKNIIHRDIKLENIMIYRDFNDDTLLYLKLIDFGLATTCDNIQYFRRCGTPGYVAPEILKDDPYDTRVDIFSAGVILFMMLSGHSPFAGKNDQEVFKSNIKVNFKFNTKYWSKISKEARDLVSKLLTLNPDSRIDLEDCLIHDFLLPTYPLDERKDLIAKRKKKDLDDDHMEIPDESPAIYLQNDKDQILDLYKKKPMKSPGAFSTKSAFETSNELNSPSIHSKNLYLDPDIFKNSSINSPFIFTHKGSNLKTLKGSGLQLISTSTTSNTNANIRKSVNDTGKSMNNQIDTKYMEMTTKIKTKLRKLV